MFLAGMFLSGVENSPQPGPYADLICAIHHRIRIHADLAPVRLQAGNDMQMMREAGWPKNGPLRPVMSESEGGAQCRTFRCRKNPPASVDCFQFRPDTAKPLCELADILLYAPNTLSPGERELIATCVSSRNDCDYCQSSHGAIAAHHLDGNEELIAQAKRDFERAAVSDKLKALLTIAGKVQRGGVLPKAQAQ